MQLEVLLAQWRDDFTETHGTPPDMADTQNNPGRGADAYRRAHVYWQSVRVVRRNGCKKMMKYSRIKSQYARESLVIKLFS